MKSRFSTFDIRVILAELHKSSAMGLRVANVYDIDNKTYLIKLGGTDVKLTLLIESGNRLHLTEFDWPKNSFPSGFSMKCRKHINGRRLSGVNQLGVDRIIDLCFGYEEAAYHLIIELYDRGNIVLTDYQYTILQILRTRTDNEDVRFAVKERYPVEKARNSEPPISKDRLKEILRAAKPKDAVKRVLNPHFVFGPALLEHCILESGLDGNLKAGQCLNSEGDIDALIRALEMADRLMFGEDMPLDKGFIIQKKQETASLGPEQTEDNKLHTYAEFHPCFFKQFEGRPFLELNSFNKAVDEFFSKLESQKLDVKALAKEKMALKKLENVKKDHEKRVEALQKSQDEDMRKAALIEMNLPLVDQAIKVLNSAIANQIDWEEIEDIVKEAQAQHDPVALAIKSLKLSSNQFSIVLSDPFDDGSEDSASDSGLDESIGNSNSKKGAGVLVDIDLGMNAFGNARGYHTKRRHASKKEEKTLQASKKALKSAERKTRETLKEVATTAVINRARKQYWFEKFLWFVSSENYLVIGGRDQQQNEIIVKRYLRQGDLYFHADIHGATSLVLKNPSGQPVPPRTLLEAGTMAICHSAAWEARVVTSAWWVHHNQVSKTAPSGEYLTTGSFMIRGKKNYLPPAQLVMGYGFIFKLEESCIARHLNERRVKELEAEDGSSQMEEETTELDLGDDDDDDDLSTKAVESLSLEDKESLGMEERDNIEEDQNDLKDNQDHESLVEAPEEEESEEGPVFPDTSIQLHHVTGDTFQLQSSIAGFPEHQRNEDGDTSGGRDFDKAQRSKAAEGKQRISAKQRRQLKKQKRGKQDEEGSTISQGDEDAVESTENDHGEENGQLSSDRMKTQPLKRGQKSKQKKIKEKYKDQDDEDREVVMQLLGSAGKPKEAKSKKEKGKKDGRQFVKQKGKGGAPKSQHIFAEDLPSKSEQTQHEELKEVEDSEVKEEEEESTDLGREDTHILNTLTGCPDEEDLLLFAVPVCAPYSSLQSYKFKVKVTPGTGRRGKAAKTALHLFMTSKETTQREKDLFRSLKDADISRDMPGKVKVSAPNLQKAKHK